MMDVRPGLDPRRLVQLMRSSIDRCHLNLFGATVLTEAATGAYVVTPIISAMAGAKRVIAITRSSRYGSLEEVKHKTEELAHAAGVETSLEVVAERAIELVAAADVITNSGHLRPIDAEMVAWMQSTAVIPLMYEAWELRPSDIDLPACRKKGIRLGGTNERHPAVDVFSFLGLMAVKLTMDAGVAPYQASVLLLCDNPFQPFIETGLRNMGAKVASVQAISDITNDDKYDAIFVALKPRSESVISREDGFTISARWPGAPVIQFWGDLDRENLLAANVPVWPVISPGVGHMGSIPSEIGPEPIVRLQTAGLKVGEILWRQARRETCEADFESLVQNI